MPIRTENIQLDQLLETTTPAELRKTLLEVYFFYVINKQGVFPINFPEITGNIYHLVCFLDELESITSN